ncbi:hypothetical protein [Shewanella sp. Iso12]|uniref:hypothetical protein n=1 Tax=Shewanella sp. Iso12 TaxID=1826753 RepID=UPI001431E70A|nr:hypothetical protein [Shewanella sp. Iso12]NJI86939.1 hypothetical protein [Shewanella sp. Iso12]
MLKNHYKSEEAIERAKQLFLDGWIVSLGLSGKDSGAASVCVVEGLKRAFDINKNVGPLYIVTTNTTLDNMVLHDYMMRLHDDLNQYASFNGLPIETETLRPSLSNNPMVEYVGRGKLLRTPQTASNGRDCAVDWKIKPMEKFLKSVQKKHQTLKVVSISGSRDSESTMRAANLKKRNESAYKMVRTQLGWSLAIIKDWSLSDVWGLFKILNEGDFDSYSSQFDEMRKHYSAGNGGTCDLFAGAVSRKECGARFGCVLCAMNPSDDSLEAQIAISPKTYGFMQPLNQLRRYMINTLFDYNHRSLLGREMKNGYIKVGINQYSLEYRMNLLRYILTIQQEAFHRYGYHPIDLIDYEELIAIQYHWSREGGEPEPGMAFKIWDEIVNVGKSYPIPETVKIVPQFNPTYTYFPLEAFLDKDGAVGLDDEGLDGEYKSLARVYYRKGEKHRVVRYFESEKLEVDLKEGKAMMFVESFYPYLVENGFLQGKCPTVMLKHLLESGVVKIPKGSIARLDKDAKRAQTLFSLRTTTGLPVELAILGFSLSKRILDISAPVSGESVPQTCLVF